ncbi:MAG: hypothetical protein GYA51_14600 [Candidatus Methanofastidiosa archaeon]|jgi:hypothetical protein|nr:hypothetical protein [Candidatus Methanofastidiosa archaeon]
MAADVLLLGIGTAILLFLTVELITFILFNTTKDYKLKTMYYTMGETFGIMGYLFLFIFLISSSDILNALLKFSPSSYPQIARSSSILMSVVFYTIHVIIQLRYKLSENEHKNEYIIYLIFGALGYIFYLYGIAAGVR